MMRLALFFLVAPSAAASEIDVSFADSSYTKVFSEQWSYDQQTSSGHAKHFDVGSHGGRTALRIRIYQDDKALSSGSGTCPRSELSQTDKANGLQTDVSYVAQWDAMLQQYTSGYQYAFMQIFGRNGPNIFLRQVRGKYNLLCEKCSSSEGTLPGSAEKDLGKWVAWKVEFRLSAGSSGHLRVYKDGVQVHSYAGPTSDGSSHHFKLGLYTQQKPCEAKDATLLLSRLSIASGSQPSPSPTPPPTPTPSPSPSGADTLNVQHRLEAGEHLVSASGAARLEMQAADGNLVLYSNGHAVWSTGTSGHGGAHLSMQSDGNLVLRDGSSALWSSGAHSRAVKAVLQDDCDLTLRSSSDSVLWSLGSACSTTLV